MNLDKINAELMHYEIVVTTGASNQPIMFEDGQYHTRPGYQIVNKHTGVVEHTSALLPGILFQAQHFDKTLEELTNPTVHPALDSMPVEDVVAN